MVGLTTFLNETRIQKDLETLTRCRWKTWKNPLDKTVNERDKKGLTFNGKKTECMISARDKAQDGNYEWEMSKSSK